MRRLKKKRDQQGQADSRAGARAEKAENRALTMTGRPADPDLSGSPPEQPPIFMSASKL